MDASLFIAKTGLTAQQTRMQVISNNLANVNTTGFKKDRAVFEDLLYQNVVPAGGQADAQTQTPTGLMLGTGTRVVATEKLHGQGNIISTENALDIAIAGEGFLSVQQADGTVAYTRDGSMKLDAQGQLVTAGGEAIIPAIQIPQNAISVTIGRDGTVTAELANGGGAAQVGQINLSIFVNNSGLRPIGRNLMLPTEASGAAIVAIPGEAGSGMLMQGSLEASNVNVVEEMVNMIETQRAYEINSKAIVLSFIWFGGCSVHPNMNPTPEFAPIQPIPEAKPTIVTGAIFTNGRDLFGDLRSYQSSDIKVGDLVTVLLNETTQASRTSALATSRTTTNDAIGDDQKNSIVNKIGFGEGFFTNVKTTGAALSSDGTGTAGQAASLTGSISAMVVEVLSNGNLVIIGEKQLALTEGSEYIRLKGIIRPSDIQPDNTVLSQRIASAQISYRGTGELASASRASWGTGLLYKLWPF